MPFVKKSEQKKTASVQLDVRGVFIGREQELYFIREYLLDPEVPDYNLVSFYGQGGVGKSTLLSRLESEIHTTPKYKDSCLTARVNERQLTPASVMEAFANQLSLKGEFEKALGHFKEALLKLFDEHEQERETIGRKVTVTLAGSLAKSIPVVGGPLGQGAEQVSEWLLDEIMYRQRLKAARHLENPLQDLTCGFLTELNKLAERQGAGNKRILLCFDTFEQLSPEIAPWLLDYFLTEEINERVVLVVSGRHALSRSTPNDPKRWLEYSDANVLYEIELKTFSKEETTSYLAQRGITEETRVNQIWQISHGLPLYLGMLTSSLKGKLDPTANVVQNFLRWILQEEEIKRRLVLDAALFSRAFNRDDLKAFAYIGKEQQAELYPWLLTQPFVRGPDTSGRHSYHEVAQEMFSRYFFIDSPQGCRETRRSLVTYYQQALDAVEASEGEQAPEVEEWLELAQALILQLFLLPDEKELVHAIELVVQAIGTELETDRGTKIGNVLQILQSGLRSQMTQRASKIVESLVVYQEGKVDELAWYEAINELLQKNHISLKYSSQTRITFYFRRNNGYYKQNEHEKSLSDLDKILELEPQNVMAHNRKGVALDELKRHEEALLAYEQAIQLDPNYVRAYSNKGIVLNELKRHEEALLAYEQAIQLDPNYKYIYDGKGDALYNLGRYEEALLAYEQAIRLDPNDAYASNSKGRALHQLKRYEEALVTFEQVIHLDPNGAYAYYNKGLILNNLERYEEALLANDRAIQLDSTYTLAYDHKNSLLYSLKSLKRYEQALQAYEQAIRLDPNALTYGNVLSDLKTFNVLSDLKTHLERQRCTLDDLMAELASRAVELLASPTLAVSANHDVWLTQTLLRWTGSAIIIDPGAALWHATAKQREAMGSRIIRFALTEPLVESFSYNPLNEVRRLTEPLVESFSYNPLKKVRRRTPKELADLTEMAKLLTNDPSEKEKVGDAALLLLMVLVRYMEDTSEPSLSGVAEYLEEPSFYSGMQLISYLNHVNDLTRPGHLFCAALAKEFETRNNEAYVEEMFLRVRRTISSFATQPLGNRTKGHDLSLAALVGSEKPTTLYVTFSEHDVELLGAFLHLLCAQFAHGLRDAATQYSTLIAFAGAKVALVSNADRLVEHHGTAEMGKLQSLQEFSLNGHLLQVPPANIIEQGTFAIRAYFLQTLHFKKEE